MVKKLWGTDADPLAHKGDWEKRLAKVTASSPSSGIYFVTTDAHGWTRIQKSFDADGR